MAFYTRKGDNGSTSHIGHGRVSKGSIEIEIEGRFDTAVTMVGFARESLVPQARLDTGHATEYEILLDDLLRDQSRLFAAAVCTFCKTGCDHPLVQSDIEKLEERIDFYSGRLPALTGFVLPGGSEENARLNLARTAVRDLERTVVRARDEHGFEDINEVVLRYLNRLSDALYVYARYALLLDGRAEMKWSD